jgi:hypothetical protein
LKVDKTTKVNVPDTSAARNAKLMLPKIYCRRNGLILSRFSAEFKSGIVALVIQNLPQTRLRNRISGIMGGILMLANKITSGLFNLNKKARAIAAIN